MLVCEVALGNVMNSLFGGSSYNTNSAGYFVDGSDDYARGYHSVRIMGKKGPDFNQNWIQTTDILSPEVIWPIGDHVSYPTPRWRVREADTIADAAKSLKEIV